MDYNKVSDYMVAVFNAIKMFKKDIISYDELEKSELHFMSKYCIKPNSIYRLNDLINNHYRVMYIAERKE